MLSIPLQLLLPSVCMHGVHLQVATILDSESSTQQYSLETYLFNPEALGPIHFCEYLGDSERLLY
ncbi:hypothetical protein M758_1G080100 [Ceratodon purpureus]|uniref:Uncharacterized protein n=1 Tax=Ceratodon purpureus TaxID=3225 RepID=A0A8T0J3U7_CERPU|nr:hypothetical protein KC19_1G081900 [Ceratodon purpureus]KAG0629146.1 hypothetical protein M758_1G080100 [Ceratodon purpureus]